MTLRCDPSAPAPRATGFTLIEMLVVLAILGVALTLVIGYRPPWTKSLDIESAAAQIASQLRLERSAAIASNRSTTLALDLNGHVFRAGDMRPEPLPPHLSVELLTVAGEQRTKGVADIRFNPDGSSTGGRITLDDGARHIAIGVEWLTGKVTVADVR